MTKQGSGKGQACSSDPFVMDYCDAECVATFGPTTTTTTTTKHTTSAFADSFISTAPTIPLENDEDTAAILRMIAIYFIMAFLACIITALMIGVFKRKDDLPATGFSNPQLLPSIPGPLPPSARKTVNLVATNNAQRMSHSGARRNTRQSDSSPGFAATLGRIRQSVLGGDLLADLSSSESEDSSSDERLFLRLPSVRATRHTIK